MYHQPSSTIMSLTFGRPSKPFFDLQDVAALLLLLPPGRNCIWCPPSKFWMIDGH
jgi:hypothetical protein